MNSSSPPPLPDVVAAEKRRDRIIAAVVVTVAGVIGLSIIALLILRAFGLLRPFSVPTGAMAPAIAPGDNVVMEGITYLARKPERSDVIVFKTDQITLLGDRAIYTMRVVGLPGDRLSLANGVLHVNGEVASLRNKAGEIHYIVMPNTRYLAKENETVTVPEQHYFVLGDNSAHSSDSRFWGFVPAKAVLGRNVFCYWPVQHFGPIE